MACRQPKKWCSTGCPACQSTSPCPRPSPDLHPGKIIKTQVSCFCGCNTSHYHPKSLYERRAIGKMTQSWLAVSQQLTGTRVPSAAAPSTRHAVVAAALIQEPLFHGRLMSRGSLSWVHVVCGAFTVCGQLQVKATARDPSMALLRGQLVL